MESEYLQEAAESFYAANAEKSLENCRKKSGADRKVAPLLVILDIVLQCGKEL